MSGKKNTIDEAPLRSTPGDFDRFMKSTMWFDIQETIKDRLEILQQNFLNADDMDEIRNIQGQMVAWKELLGLPGYLKLCAHKEQPVNQNELDLDE